MNRLVAIVGPTATGKTALAISLAQRFNGEIIGADSRQVYRHMDIGIAKPTPEERAAAPHHLIGIIEPDEEFSLPVYQRQASGMISELQANGKLPLLVGGSGLYVWAVLEGWQVPEIPPDVEARRALEQRASAGDDLYAELVSIDPAAATKIDPHNVRRVIRALEVSRLAGTPFSTLQRKQAPPFESLIIGLTASRENLYRRIDERVDRMIANGLIDEVKKLIEMGFGPDLPAMSSAGYREIGMYLHNEIALEEAIRRIKTSTHRVARHQYAWFRLTDKRIHWYDIDSDFLPGVIELVEAFAKGPVKE